MPFSETLAAQSDASFPQPSAPPAPTFKQLNLTVKVSIDAKLSDLVVAAEDTLGEIIGVSASPYYDYYG